MIGIHHRNHIMSQEPVNNPTNNQPSTPTIPTPVDGASVAPAPQPIPFSTIPQTPTPNQHHTTTSIHPPVTTTVSQDHNYLFFIIIFLLVILISGIVALLVLVKRGIVSLGTKQVSKQQNLKQSSTHSTHNTTQTMPPISQMKVAQNSTTQSHQSISPNQSSQPVHPNTMLKQQIGIPSSLNNQNTMQTQMQSHTSSTMLNQTTANTASPIVQLPQLTNEDKEKASCFIELGNGNGAIVVSASLIGNSHLRASPQIPCQDNHAISNLGNGWGVAVSCDGAGSYVHSHKGSQFAAEELKKASARAVEHFQWKTKNQLPDEHEWRDIAKQIFGLTYTKLVDYSKKLGLADVEQLSCTAIITIFSPLGLLVAHVGDGRACYKDKDDRWHAMIRPFSGDGGGTAFLATDFVWKELFQPLKNNKEQNDLIRTCLDVFMESRVINEPVQKFVLMSDGCEEQLYTTKQLYTSLGGKYIDINKPHDENLNKLLDILTNNIFTQTYDSDKNRELVMEQRLISILRDTDGFKQEDDDKTLVIGFLA